MEPELYFASREDWREWLQENFDKEQVLRLVYYKKHTKKQCITYRESLEEALCFGWIDGLLNKLDEDRYTRRFTPRRKGSKWSKVNIALAKKLIEESRMESPGQAAFDKMIPIPEQIKKVASPKIIPLTPEIEKVLKADAKIWEKFNSIAPSHRKLYSAWLTNAKKPETLARRLKIVIEDLKLGNKPGMK